MYGCLRRSYPGMPAGPCEKIPLLLTPRLIQAIYCQVYRHFGASLSVKSWGWIVQEIASHPCYHAIEQLWLVYNTEEDTRMKPITNNLAQTSAKIYYANVMAEFSYHSSGSKRKEKWCGWAVMAVSQACYSFGGLKKTISTKLTTILKSRPRLDAAWIKINPSTLLKG